jgi:ribonuclease BN (tRNA processing enzyme)
VPRRCRAGGSSREQGVAGTVAAASLLGSGTASALDRQPAPPVTPGEDASRFRSRLVLLGTAGGPPWWPGSTRAGIGSAVVVEDDVYVVDFGDGSGKRFKEAALVPRELQTPGALWGEENIRAMFLTHLHSDHVGDYFDYFMLGWYNGLTSRRSRDKIQVFGPGRRVDDAGNIVLEPIFHLPHQPPPNVPLMNPMNPVPGIVDMTNYLFQAFALDLNDRMRDNLKPDLHALFDVHDIAIPKGIGYHPNNNPSPRGMAPIPVYRDNRVRVTATLVNHFPVVPAFGFRFDTGDGSVTFSGDTAPNDNLVALAKGSDILVHEVIDPAWVDALFPPPVSPPAQALKNHLLKAHTVPEDVGRIAQRAGVKTLVLSHLVPANAPDEHWHATLKTFHGQLVIGNDLMQLPVGSTVKRR